LLEDPAGNHGGVHLNWIVLGLMEIAAGLLFHRHRATFLGYLQESDRRPFPTSPERDRRIVDAAGPFIIGIGATTIVLGLL
jgi:hypothetical protein